MRTHTLAAACVLAALYAPAPAGASGEISANRNPVMLGESVTLRWLFTGTKVTVKGGSFGAGKVVTGKTSLTDTPRKSTRYTFDVTYSGKKAGTSQMVPLKARYFIDIEVVNPTAMGLVSYSGIPGWKVNYLKGWKYDKAVVSSSTIIYFQPEDDAIERFVVSTMPVQEGSSGALADKVKKDLFNGYDQLEILSDEPTTYNGVPANVITFAGNPNSHSGTRTQSVILVFTRAGRGYVISGRTFAAKFNARKPLLESMVKSFTFTGAATAHQ